MINKELVCIELAPSLDIYVQSQSYRELRFTQIYRQLGEMPKRSIDNESKLTDRLFHRESDFKSATFMYSHGHNQFAHICNQISEAENDYQIEEEFLKMYSHPIFGRQQSIQTNNTNEGEFENPFEQTCIQHNSKSNFEEPNLRIADLIRNQENSNSNQDEFRMRKDVILKGVLRKMRAFFYKDICEITRYLKYRHLRKMGYYERCLISYIKLKLNEDVTSNLVFMLGSISSPTIMTTLVGSLSSKLFNNVTKISYNLSHINKIHNTLYKFSLRRFSKLSISPDFYKLITFFYEECATSLNSDEQMGVRFLIEICKEQLGV